MLVCMRTTIRIDDGLFAQVRQLAASSGRTLTEVIDDALREMLARRARVGRRAVELPTSCAGGRLLPGVDLDDSAGLLDLMESPDPPR